MGHRIEEGWAQKLVNRADEIRAALEAGFSTQSLEVIDESAQHVGHAGYQPGGQSHFRVRMTSADFAGQSRIARHRAVHAAIGKDLLSQIHALALELDVG